MTCSCKNIIGENFYILFPENKDIEKADTKKLKKFNYLHLYLTIFFDGIDNFFWVWGKLKKNSQIFEK